MMENKSKSGVLIALIVVLFITAISFGVWKFVLSSSDADVDNSTETSEITEDEAEEAITEGTISGSLTYPSESLPEMEVHALNLDTNVDYFTSSTLQGDEYTYGYGYELSVPAGRYHVYAMLVGNDGSQKAYYNEFVKCGMSVECTDTTILEVEVVAGEQTSGIMLGDWYNI